MEVEEAYLCGYVQGRDAQRDTLTDKLLGAIPSPRRIETATL